MWEGDGEQCGREMVSSVGECEGDGEQCRSVREMVSSVESVREMVSSVGV